MHGTATPASTLLQKTRQVYGYAASFDLKASCEAEVVQQLREMNRRAAEVPLRPGLERYEALYAQQYARLAHNAEKYYRTMFQRRVSSWNLRDSHMAETLYALDRDLNTVAAPPRRRASPCGSTTRTWAMPRPPK